MLAQLESILITYQKLGNAENDSTDLRLRKASLLLIPLIIGVLAIPWGLIYIGFGYYLSAAIPLSYSVISALSIWYLAKTKNIIPMLQTQLLLVLFLPFCLMWSLGGFAAGSFVMIWAFYAPIAALIYESEQRAMQWFLGFVTLVIISGLIDQSLISSIQTMPVIAIELFFVLNLSMGSIGIFFIIQHFIKEKEKSADALLQKEHTALLQTTAELRQAHNDLEQLAHHDPLTQLTNRARLSHRLDQLIHAAKRSQHKFAIFFIDLDNFKHINDTYGHPMGDHILVAASERLKAIARAEDVIARFGGDEFVFAVQLNDLATDTLPVAKRILESFSDTFEINGVTLHITPSIGIALYPDNGGSTDMLLKNADTAMYRAKHNGRNNFCYYSEQLTTEIASRMDIEGMLRHALERDEFSLRFQVQVDAIQQKIHGLEVLLRWHQQDKGFIPPDIFIPISEDSGQIYAIGHWVIEQSCQFMVQLLSQGYDLPHISINVSGIQFMHEQFVFDVKHILQKTGLEAKYVELELTESVIMNDRSQTLSNLHQLADMGIALSIDDFGTGYSSLSYLKKLPVDTIKIDRSFVCDICTDDEDKAITEAIIVLGKALNLKIIAEAVEHIDQLNYLTSQGCHLIQGYLFSKPVNADELTRLLNKPQELFDDIKILTS
jgi:diguanylate cyclase (GGDEF)-like protein